LDSTDDEVKQDHLHSDLLGKDIYVSITDWQILDGQQVFVFHDSDLDGNYNCDGK